MDLVIEGTSSDEVGKQRREMSSVVLISGWNGLKKTYLCLGPSDFPSTPFLLLAATPLFRYRRHPGSNLMYRCEIGRQRGNRKTTGHTREGPDVLPRRKSLPDRTGIDGGSHGAEGEDERNKSEIEQRFYRVGGGVYKRDS